MYSGGIGMPFHVYVLVNPNGETYVGQTNNLQLRLAEHNNPDFEGTLHTKRHAGPWRLVHTEECGSRSRAMERERQLKSGGGRRFIQSLLNGRVGC